MPDGSAIYFVTSRAPDGFGQPVAIAELNTAASDHLGSVSDDGCVIYFARNVGVASSNFDIFVATRAP